MDTTENKTGDTKGVCCDTSVMHSARVQGSLTLVLILLATFLFAQTINALKTYQYIGSGVASTNTVTVTGEGEKFVRPDTAEFTFTIYEEADTAVAVQDAVSAKANEIVDVLKEQGLTEDDIKVLTYVLQPQYVWEPATCPTWGKGCNRKRVQSGFMLRQVVRVSVDDLGKTAALISLATEKGASEVSTLSFMVADAELHEEEARAEAIKDAQEKAEKLAADLGVTLVRVVGFSEGRNYPEPVMRTFAMDEAVGATALESAPVLPMGENHITSNVHVTYEIK